jgi:hypothetical protein
VSAKDPPTDTEVGLRCVRSSFGLWWDVRYPSETRRTSPRVACGGQYEGVHGQGL